MQAVFVIALLALAEAVEYAKPEQQLPEPIELPEHIKTLITNHINHVLQQKPQGHQSTLVLTGHVPQPGQVQVQGQGKAAGVVVVPHLDLLPPHKQPQVINHQVTASHGPHIVLALPGQLPVDIGDKVNKLQQHVAHVMQQAEQHIPNAINQAIKEHKKQQQEVEKKKEEKQQEEKQQEKKQQEEKQKEEKLRHNVEEQQEEPQQSGRLLLSAVQVPELLEKQRELQQLGKCNFACPQKALPICASNGKCTVEFPGQCELSQWNCFNTKNVFHQVHDDECHKIIKCYDRDML